MIMNRVQYFNDEEVKHLPFYYRFMYQMDYKAIRQMESGYDTSTKSKIHKSSAYQRYVNYKPTSKLQIKKIENNDI